MTPQLEANSAPLEMNPDVGGPDTGGTPDVTHLLEITLHAEIVLGTLEMKLKGLSELKAGTILKTLRAAGEPVDLLVNSTLVAKAEVCPQGEKLGVRVLEMASGD